MKALPVWQPWASLVAWGAKRYETRSWKPPDALIGQRIAIHATKTGLSKRELDALMEQEPFHSALFFRGITAARLLPVGCILATVRLAQVHEITPEFARRLEREWPDELRFGDYTPGRYAWRLDKLAKPTQPIPAKGRQGIFEVGIIE